MVAGSSAAYRKVHPTGTQWVNRARLEPLADALRERKDIVVFGDDDALAVLVALDLRERPRHARVDVVRGGVAAGLTVESTPEYPRDEARLDYLFWAHDRHDGNVAAISQYLAWEEPLPAQIGDPVRAGYRSRTPH